MSSAQVNRPTNVKDKQADINQKLQFYGIATGKSPFCAYSGETNGGVAQLSRMEKSHL